MSKLYLDGRATREYEHDWIFLPYRDAFFAAVVILGAIVFIALEAMDKVESIQKRAPWIPKLLKRRDAFVALLLICFVLLIGNGYELLTKEIPEAPSAPAISFSAPNPLKDAQIKQLQKQVRDLETHQEPVKRTETQTVAELCRTLPKCPIAEIQRRALVLATRIDALYSSFETKEQKARDLSRTMAFDKTQQQDFFASQQRAISYRIIEEYNSKYQAEALTLRDELIIRIGEPGLNDSLEENIYKTPNLALLRDVAADLRKLANHRNLPSTSALKFQ